MLPGDNGICGPVKGLQCASCVRFQNKQIKKEKKDQEKMVLVISFFQWKFYVCLLLVQNKFCQNQIR